MKRILVMALSVLAVSTSVLAQGRGAPAPALPLEPGASQADVDKAVLAAPAQLRNAAMVIKWNPSDWTYTTLRKGTNGIVCYDRSGMPLQQPFSVQCTSVGNLAREAQNLKAEATGDRAKSEAMLKSLEDNGTRVKPEYGSLWYHVAGADKDHVSPHEVTIAVPGATSASIGLPTGRRENGA